MKEKICVIIVSLSILLTSGCSSMTQEEYDSSKGKLESTEKDLEELQSTSQKKSTDLNDVYKNPDSYFNEEISAEIVVTEILREEEEPDIYILGYQNSDNFTVVQYMDNTFQCNAGDILKITGTVQGQINLEHGYPSGLGIVGETIEFVEQSSTSDTELSIEPTEIYNENGVSIVLSEIEQSKSETTITFLLTSTSEKDYSISAHTYAVNNLMAGGNIVGSDVNLPAGKKAKFSVEIENQWLAENGIEKIAQLDFLFWAYYDNFKEWDTGLLELNTNLYDENLMYSASGEELYSDEHVTVWYIGNTGNDYSFVIRNNNSYDSSYTIENCSINDWSYEILNYTYDLYDEPIHANTYDTFTLSVDSDFMKEYDVSQIESIEFNILLGNETTEKIQINN